MGPGNLDGPHCRLIFDNPAECSGPPHLLGPWGSAGSGAVRVASSWRRSRPATFVAGAGKPPNSQLNCAKYERRPGRGASGAAASLDLGFAEFGVLLGDRF